MYHVISLIDGDGFYFDSLMRLGTQAQNLKILALYAKDVKRPNRALSGIEWGLRMHPKDFQMPVRQYFRKRRFKSFLSTYNSCRTILDIGGEHYTWEIIGRREGVVLLNMYSPKETDGYLYILGSGLSLPFADKSVDLAFSNSVIEHVGSEENQFQFAREMLRVGRKIYCQTPSRLFPIDPHLTMPFLHWLPGSWLKPKFLRYFTLTGWLLKKPFAYDVTWITKKKLQRMFPGCQITTERFLLLPKSFTVSN